MNWEPWTGCYKVSEGCTYCYFYEPYSKRHGQNTVQKTAEFDKPITKVEAALAKRGYAYFVLDVLSGNTRAIAFYQKHGVKRFEKD